MLDTGSLRLLGVGWDNTAWLMGEPASVMKGVFPVRVEMRTSRGLQGVIGRRSRVGGKDREGAAVKWCDRTEVALVESHDPSRAVTRG